MVCKLKTVRADMLVLQCQLERELIRYVKRYLCQPQVTIITNDKQFACWPPAFKKRAGFHP